MKEREQIDEFMDFAKELKVLWNTQDVVRKIC